MRRGVVHTTTALVAAAAATAPFHPSPSTATSAGGKHTGINRTIEEMLTRAERWPVKVGADQGAQNIDLSRPTPTTVQSLVAASRPIPNQQYSGTFGDQVRATRFDKELTYLSVPCLIVGAKWENSPATGDGDFHIVIADPTNPSTTMIAEIPDPKYVPSESPFGTMIAKVRSTFSGMAGNVTETFKTFPTPIAATVSGIGFWDFKHGQTGVAGNAIEIHPVLSIEPRTGP